MLTLWATVIKELLELRRDRAGLMVLLVMPMALVLIVSLVQDSVMQATGEAAIKVLMVDRDGGFLGQGIAKRLKEGGGLELVTSLKGQPVSEESARKAVVKGEYQFAVLIPPGTSAAFKDAIDKRARAAVVVKGRPAPAPAPTAATPGLTVYFDPAVQGTFRTAVNNALHRVLLGIEFQEQSRALAQTVPEEIKKSMGGMMNPFMGAMPAPEVSLKLDSEPLLRLGEQAAFNSRLAKRPTAAQQNVPAWALFGMFFIVVPLSGSLVRERHGGTLRRLLTMPVSPLALLAGKVCAYLLVCLAQFALMLAAGCFLLPLLGTSGLVLGPQHLALIPVALAAGLAATGYGIMVGSLAKTYEQGSMFGAVSIVIAAAIGGIMIPVYVMPRVMQEVSVISPLSWGLTAFQEILVRGGNLPAAAGEISLLLLFFAATITASWLALRRSGTAR